MIRKKSGSISILFIGNSFSYYHSLPKLIAHFARVSGSGNVIADGVFRGGATLKMLWDDGRALKKIRNGGWDYVVLQERGRFGGIVKDGIVHVGKPRSFFAYAAKFDKEIRKGGAKTILYCPPSFLGIGFLNDAKKLHAAYAALARKLHVIMIPSVAAFALTLKKRPRMNLYERDRHHPNSLGMYLVACLFYRKLFHKKASHLPLESYLSRLEKLPKNPKTVKISKANSQFLWSIVNRIK